MKNAFVSFTFAAAMSAVLLTISCATAGPAQPDTENWAGEHGPEYGLPFREALALAAERLVGDIPDGTSVAVVAFESESDGLSMHAMDELIAALINRGVHVMTRQRFELELVRREMDYGTTGYVSDETAQSIGQIIGVEIVITGHLRNIGDVHRFSANAIQVETARHVSAPRFDVRNDRTFMALRDALSAMPIPSGPIIPREQQQQPVSTPPIAIPPIEAPSRPAEISAPRVRLTAAGGRHTVTVREDGSLWAWGGNDHGQLGDNTVTDRSSPIKIGTAVNWATVAAGNRHTAAIRTDGSLWAWGGNEHGQLGNGGGGHGDRSLSPVRIGAATDWVSVAAGGNYTVAIRSDGTLWAWGENRFGQLGDGTVIDRSLPTRIGTATNWATVTVGGRHTVAIRRDGSLWAWGENRFGQLGDGPTANRNAPTRIGMGTYWAYVSAGGSHTVAVRRDGSLWAWGANESSQLGNGGGGMGDMTRVPVRIGIATTWASAAAGDRHTMAAQTDGSLWAWGWNGLGGLGDGTANNRGTPVRVGPTTTWAFVDAGEGHTVAAGTDGTLWAWGRNDIGQLGNGGGGQGDRSLVPIRIGL